MYIYIINICIYLCQFLLKNATSASPPPAVKTALASRFVWMGIEGSLFIGSMHFIRAGVLDGKVRMPKSGTREVHRTPWIFNIDTKNDALEDVSSIKNGYFGYLCQIHLPKKPTAGSLKVTCLVHRRTSIINPNHPFFWGGKPHAWGCNDVV